MNIYAVYARSLRWVRSQDLDVSRIASLLLRRARSNTRRFSPLLRCRLRFALVRCGAMCLRGSRSMFAPAMPKSPAVLVVVEANPFPKVLALFGPFWKSPFLRPLLRFLVNIALFELFSWKSAKVCLLMHAITVSSAQWALARRFWGGGKRLVKLVPCVRVPNAEKSVF